jgi:1-acyl-sn-glycerol-3-phosphate acyltransferase
MASRSIEKADRIHPRALARLAGVVLLLLLLLPLHGLWRLAGRLSPWPRHFLRWAGWCAGARVRVTGDPIRANVLFIANHVSWLDILVLGGHTGSAFVAKADMAPWPVIGWLSTLNNSVYVEREKRLDVHWQAQALKAALGSGQPLTLFPEGTTGDGRSLLAFRSSLVAAVTPPPPGISIQPVAIDYGADGPEIAWVGEEEIGVNALRVMSRRGGVAARLHFLAPLDHADFADRKAIVAHSREEIAAALGHA